MNKGRSIASCLVAIVAFGVLMAVRADIHSVLGRAVVAGAAFALLVLGCGPIVKSISK